MSRRGEPTERDGRGSDRRRTAAPASAASSGARRPGSAAGARESRRYEYDAARYRRRRLFALVVLLAFVTAGAVAGGRAFLLHSGRFQVTDIAVFAPPGVEPAALRAASGVYAGTPLLSVDLAEVGRRVAAVPQVASVRAERTWPSTVTITVTERTPVALAASANGPRLVDGTGLAYQAAPTKAPGLPRLAATRVAPGDPATEAGLAVLASLTPSVREKLQVVEAAGPASVTLRLDGGQQVRWGSPDASARKAAVLSVLLTQHGSVYDVSAPDLPTIRR